MLKNKKSNKFSTLTSASLLCAGLVFQSCTPSKLGISLDGSDSNLSEGLSYAPKSIGGSQVITDGNVVLKEYRHKATNRFFTQVALQINPQQNQRMQVYLMLQEMPSR